MAALALIAALCGCAGSQTAGFRARNAGARTVPSQEAELPYRFSIDGFDVEVSAAELTTAASAWDQTVRDELKEDERWLGVGVTVAETQGRDRLFPWITMVRLRTALGAIVNAPHALAPRDSVATDQDSIGANQKNEMRLFFRVKRGDFPVDLVFADGAAAPLGD